VATIINTSYFGNTIITNVFTHHWWKPLIYIHLPALPSPGLPVVELDRALWQHALLVKTGTGEIVGRMMGHIWKLWNIMEIYGINMWYFLWKYMDLNMRIFMVNSDGNIWWYVGENDR
jgi:hypothetical protein